jgi:hypothetical protein
MNSSSLGITIALLSMLVLLGGCTGTSKKEKSHPYVNGNDGTFAPTEAKTGGDATNDIRRGQ